jgi:hypothetical protein
VIAELPSGAARAPASSVRFRMPSLARVTEVWQYWSDQYAADELLV